MINRVNKVLIGKDISRTSALTSATLYTGTNGPAEGEVIVLDKNLKLASAGITIADTDTIFIAEGIGDTYDITGETGSTVTGIRKLIISDPIEGKNVTSYTNRAYSAIVQQVVTVDMSALTPVVGTEYTIRVVYTDTYERPGQWAVTYRYVTTTAVLATFITNFAAVVNKHTTRRVNATYTGTTLVLTGRAMPYDVTDSVTAIDEFYQPNFKVFLLSNNYSTSTVTYTTNPFKGEGTWQLVRDAEKKAQSYKGIMNRTVFPVQVPAMRVDKTKTYNAIIIESNKSYSSPDSYDKTTRLTTEVYLPVSCGQTTSILSVLNTWMASTPGNFGVLSF
jgi:hypothetical protein